MLTFQPEGDIEWQMTYDENGNLTSITNSCGTTVYTWDARNRLVGMEGFDEDCNPLSASFKYDALGRRIEKTINGRTIEYLYDGLDIVQEIEDGIVTVNYIRTLNIDEPLARITSDGTIRYYHADALGSIIALTDDLGNVKTQYNYSPFGETDLISEPSDNPFQYTGRENDGTGLYYYRARYYSPRLKRFISEDPIGLAGGINIFSYVKNSPLNFRDPYGLKSMKDPQCVNKCIAQCGGGAGKCSGEIIYLPTCEVVCLAATCGSGVMTCQFICIPVTAYSVYRCLQETNECMKKCIANCPDIPVIE
jgi:RHS repeat-associated protein